MLTPTQSVYKRETGITRGTLREKMDSGLFTLRPRDSGESELQQNVDDDHFRRLYDQVLDAFLSRMDNIEAKMNRAISFIISSFRWSEGGDFSDIDFRREDMVCGYIFRYGPHGAGLARARILESLENCKELRNILKKPQVTVASLGGGPGNDAIGFCSALSRFKFAGNLEIFVVDSVIKWIHSMFSAVNLLNQGGFGHVSDLFERKKVKIYFAPFSVPEQLNELPVKELDVFLICKLLSILSWEDKRKLVRSLYAGMKNSALILLIDSPFFEDLWCDRFDILYLSDGYQEYCSGTRDVERFGHHDQVTSRARIAVLRKRRQYT